MSEGCDDSMEMKNSKNEPDIMLIWVSGTSWSRPIKKHKGHHRFRRRIVSQQGQGVENRKQYAGRTAAFMSVILNYGHPLEKLLR